MGIRRFFWSEWGDSVHYGVDPVEPGSSNCPPDSCIELFESPHQKEKSRNSKCCFGFSGKGCTYGYNLRWRPGDCNHTLDFVTEVFECNPAP